ncbi:MAG: hypothetical protein EXR78_03680 [Deltaproteobacteria bacterium]|nr:hypothetical protein [Deltaproteobacteria bacterium]
MEPETHKNVTPDQPTSPQSSRGYFSAIVSGLMTGVRKAPVVVVFFLIALVLYYQRSFQEPPPALNPLNVKAEGVAPKPPPELPQGAAALVWNCIHQVDTTLSNGLWADVYYGMEASFDGKLVVAKVTEKWKELSDDKRQTIVKLIADTWIENAKMLKIFTSGDEMQKVEIKQLPSEESVASWKPATGVQLVPPHTEA